MGFISSRKITRRTNGCLYRDRFSFRANTSEVKAYETTDAIKNGADEVDMVINVGALKSKQYKKFKQTSKQSLKRKDKALVKVIIETALLDNEEIVKACELAKAAGADFVKTSTAFQLVGQSLKMFA